MCVSLTIFYVFYVVTEPRPQDLARVFIQVEILTISLFKIVALDSSSSSSRLLVLSFYCYSTSVKASYSQAREVGLQRIQTSIC